MSASELLMFIVGRVILPAAGLPAGWTRKKAGPRPEKAAPQPLEYQFLFDLLHYSA